MTERFSLHLLWGAALTFLLAGVLLSLHAFDRVRETRRTLSLKHGELRALQSLDSRARQNTEALQTYETLSRKQPVPLATLLKAHLSSNAPDAVRESQADLFQGWSLLKRDVSLTEVPLPDLMAFVVAAESATNRLPWCLEKCVIRASAQAAGYGQVQLVFEAFEKKGR
jgi:hypothetical protein